MNRTTRMTAAMALGLGLTAAGVAVAQSQTGSAAAPPNNSLQHAPLPPQSPPPWAKSAALSIKPWDPNASHPVYSVDPPPDGPSGIYLPSVVLGYAKSATGCVLIGCEDGPQVGGAPAPSSGSTAPTDLGPPDRGGPPQDSRKTLPGGP